MRFSYDGLDAVIQMRSTKVVNNSLWLLAMQGVNMVLPLVTVPYVTRMLGGYNYGVFSLALNWITYFQVIVQFGFTLNGARKAALLDNDDGNALNRLFSRILIARMILLACCLAALIAVYIASQMPLIYLWCLLALYLYPVGTAFQTVWLFQGKQDMGFTAIANIIGRFVSAVLIFILVVNPDSLVLYCILYSFTYVISSLVSLVFAKRRYGVCIQKVKIKEVVGEMKSGFSLFLSSAMSTLFGGFSVTMLGIFCDAVAVGAYSAIYKIPMVLTTLFSPIGQAIYPHVVKLYMRSDKDAHSYIKKVGIGSLAIFSSIAILIVLFRDPLIDMVFGAGYSEYSAVVIPLCVWMIFSILNNFLGIQMLVARGLQREYSQAFIVGMAGVVLANLCLVPVFGPVGAGLAVLSGEVVLSLALTFQIYKTRHLVS